jgi:hypothetical protein
MTKNWLFDIKSRPRGRSGWYIDSYPFTLLFKCISANLDKDAAACFRQDGWISIRICHRLGRRPPEA